MDFHDLLNDLIYYGKTNKRLFDCSDVTEFPYLAEVGIVEDFETIGNA